MLQEWIHKNLQPCGTKYFKKIQARKWRAALPPNSDLSQ